MEYVLARLSELRPHEKPASKARVEGIAADIAFRGAVLKPIIVEESTFTIVDGHHRYHALRMLGAKYVPVVLASYTRHIASIEPPVRRIDVPAPPGEAALLLAELLEKLAGSGGGEAVVSDGLTTVKARVDPLNAYWALGESARILAAKRCNEVSSVAVRMPRLNREHIIEAALAGRPLPPRSTLHVTELKRLLRPVKLGKLL